MIDQLELQLGIDLNAENIFLWSGKNTKAQKMIISSKYDKKYFFCKIARNNEQNAFLINEYNMINELRRNSSLARLLPNPRLKFKSGIRVCTCYDYIKGLDLKSLLFKERNASYLKTVFECKAQIDKDSFLANSSLKFISSYDTSIQDFYNNKCEILNELRVGNMHGDFIASNILCEKDRVWITDFETAVQEGFPLMDLHWFLIHLLSESSVKVLRQALYAYRFVDSDYYRKSMSDSNKNICERFISKITAMEIKSNANAQASKSVSGYAQEIIDHDLSVIDLIKKLVENG